MTDQTKKHTKGPWQIIEKPRSTDRIVGSENKDICYMIESSCIPIEITKANAKLIAAAPELLEALQRFVINADQSWSGAANVVIQAKDAIKKATE